MTPADKGTHISLHDLVSLIRVVQHVDRQVRDGNGGRGGERNQEHQHTFALLQRQVQFVCALFAEERQVNGTPEVHKTNTVPELVFIPVRQSRYNLKKEKT